MAVKQFKKRSHLRKLLSEIVSMQPGSRFCTVKDIINRYSISQATVDKALKPLKSNGYIDATAGRGIYVKAEEVEQESLFVFCS